MLTSEEGTAEIVNVTKMVTMSMQNSEGNGDWVAQGRFYLPHSSRVLLFCYSELTLSYGVPSWAKVIVPPAARVRLLENRCSWQPKGMWNWPVDTAKIQKPSPLVDHIS